MLTVDGAVKLVDFGVAKALSKAATSQTRMGAIRGKLGYSAPEQLRGKQVDHRTDLFAVGILVHELLTGRRLFQGDDDPDTIEHVLSGPIYPPSRINPGVPIELDAIVMRALERDPARRFQDGDEMADAFEPLIHKLAWGPAKITRLLCARFPELDPALLASSSEFGTDDEHTVVSLPEMPPTDSAQHITLRPTASFVRAADDMGAWTTLAPVAAEPAQQSGSETVRVRPIKLPKTPEPPVAPAPEPVRVKVQAPPERPTKPLPPRAVAQAPSRHSSSNVLPRLPRPKRSRVPAILIGTVLAIVVAALVVAKTRPQPSPEPIRVAIPQPALPQPAPATTAPAPIPPQPTVEPADRTPALVNPFEKPAATRREHTAPARTHADKPAPTRDNASLLSADFDQSPLFTGKDGASDREPPASKPKPHRKSQSSDPGLLPPAFQP